MDAHTLQQSMSRRAPSRLESVGGTSQLSARSVLDMGPRDQAALEETFRLALQKKSERRRRTSASSTEAPSAVELSSLLADLKREAEARPKRDLPQTGARARRTSTSSTEVPTLSNAAVPRSDLDANDQVAKSPPARRAHQRPPAPTRGRRSACGQSHTRDASPVPRSRRSRSPAPPSIASAVVMVQRASQSHRASSRRASVDLDSESTDGDKPGPSSAVHAKGEQTKLVVKPSSEFETASESIRQPYYLSKDRTSRASASRKSSMSRPVSSSEVARNLRRVMALTSSEESDTADTDSLAGSAQKWRPSPRAKSSVPGLRKRGNQQISAYLDAQKSLVSRPMALGQVPAPPFDGNDAYTAIKSRLPRLWATSESDTDAQPAPSPAKPSLFGRSVRRHRNECVDLEKGLVTQVGPDHIRSQSLPTQLNKPRLNVPFHERPFPRARRMNTRMVAGAVGYASDNGGLTPVAGVFAPATHQSTYEASHRQAHPASRSTPNTPAQSPDPFAHMCLPPAFSPRPGEGMPPYFPLLPMAPHGVDSGWSKWLSYGSRRRSQFAGDMRPGELRRSARAEAMHRLRLDEQRIEDVPITSVKLSRREARLAAAAASAAGSSAAARAYHMFAKRAYEKMSKSASTPTGLSAQNAPALVHTGPPDEGVGLPKSVSAPDELVARAKEKDKASQLQKTLTELAEQYQDHFEPLVDVDLLTAPRLLHDGTPVPTDAPSDTEANANIPSDETPGQDRDQHGTFRVLRRAPQPATEPTLRLVQPHDERAAMIDKEEEEYARLLFDWDGMDEYSEDDDDLHDPSKPISPSWLPCRMLINVGSLVLTALVLVGLFAALPIFLDVRRYLERHRQPPNVTQATVNGMDNLRWSIIDPDTPAQAMQRMGGLNGRTKYNLVFSDEFNVDERTFGPGMDPWWEAVDLHYWGTGDLERYDPNQITTSGGALRIKLEARPLGGLNFRSGMLQSWNKLCMNGAGYLEVAAQLPGYANVSGLWPSVFTLGNLGRAGYGATLEGMWPYSYNTCDVGTLTNQTTTDGYPASAAMGGNTLYNRKHDTQAISFLPGQKLSACTCPQDDHPGPRLQGDDGQTYAVGRSVPEIDLFEAQVSSTGVLGVSQSVQMAPFNYLYKVSNSTGPAFTVFNNNSRLNGYNGEVTQQSISFVTPTVQGAVQHPALNAPLRAPDGAIQARPGYAVYGYEIEPGPQGHLQWVAGGVPSFRMNAAAFDPDPISAIGRRVYSEEPMSIIMNLAISGAWSQPDWDNLAFPAIMSIDYIRLYAPATADPTEAISCDPDSMPTSDYIKRHAVAYNNPNLTVWGGAAENGGYEAPWPRNSLQPHGCKAPLSTFPGSPLEPIPKAPYVPASEIGP